MLSQVTETDPLSPHPPRSDLPSLLFYSAPPSRFPSCSLPPRARRSSAPHLHALPIVHVSTRARIPSTFTHIRAPECRGRTRMRCGASCASRSSASRASRASRASPALRHASRLWFICIFIFFVATTHLCDRAYRCLFGRDTALQSSGAYVSLSKVWPCCPHPSPSSLTAAAAATTTTSARTPPPHVPLHVFR